MILKWIQSSGAGAEAMAAKAKDDEERKSRKDSGLVDLAHEALVRRAAKDKNALDGLVRMGVPAVKREMLKGKVRGKVWDVVGSGSLPADSEMVEEITERITDAAESDPFYKRMFSADGV